MRDFYSNVKEFAALRPDVYIANTAGFSVDMLGARAALFTVNTGTIVGAAVFGVKLQESNDGSTWNDVAAAEVQSDAPTVLVATTAYRLGYLGNKQKARVYFTYTSGTSLAIGAVCLIEPFKRPVA